MAAVAGVALALGADLLEPSTDQVLALGGNVELKVPAGTKTGRRLRLKGRGMPGTPPGIWVKSSLPLSFCATVNGQWSLLMMSSAPDRNMRHMASWSACERSGGEHTHSRPSGRLR